MKSLMFLCASLCAMAFAVATTPAQAANTRSWVSQAGSDALPGTCTEAEPCLTFAHAITQTSAGGEIDCLTGGDFGPVTITQSITIDCGAGQVGAIAVSSANAITINTSSSSTVTIRNLSINGLNTSGGLGIDAASFSSGTLIIQHCSIFGFSTGSAILFEPSSSRGLIMISGSTIYNNLTGVQINPGAGVIASVLLDDVKIAANASLGLIFQGSGIVAGVLRHSIVAENGSDGIQSLETSYFTIEESSIVDNLGNGIRTFVSGANVEVGASTIGGNGTGVDPQSGAIYTFGNNQISANGSNGSFTPGGPGLQ